MIGRTVRILVTGAAGFIGSQYVRAALTSGFADITDGERAATQVTVLDALRLVDSFAALDPVAGDPRLRLVHGDIGDARLVDGVVAGHDAIVHFAAESHVDSSIADPARFVATNVVGTQILLDAAVRHGVGRFVHVSTDEVYGSIAAGTVTESAPLAPSSPYAATKAASDLLVLAAHRTHGLDVVVTRCVNNYGPYQYPEKIIPLFVANLLRGRPVGLYGDGGNVRQWVHVDDHCRAVEAARVRGASGRIYHIAGTAELRNSDLTARLVAACDADPALVGHVADRPGHDRRYALDDTLTRDTLGWVPRIAFDDGLAATVDWYRAHRAWWERLVD
jgi:dTDP-glucose 4,6-dehydratase